MALNYGPRLVTDGLVLALDAADINSYPGTGSTWFDLSGNNNHVTAVNGPDWISSGYFSHTSNSYFSGVGGQSIPIGNSTYTMLVWAKQRSEFGWGANYGFISIGGYGENNQSNALRTQDNTDGHFWHYWWLNDVGVSSNDAGISLDQWFLVAATFDGLNRRIWINGNLSASDIPGSNHDVKTTDIQISKTYGDEYQRGDIAVARIYNRALTSTEMMSTFINEKTRFGL